ncbi:class I SAM-dependent methyltransferase [Mucilaginibacter sp. X5P1]|uniref:class I SAM-dependent methyltransferase n=1 Tax=Mucilaginibacter sp. X5P1 TaxID=2723088 RepID=UPI001618BDFD|nr:class I SAM-dependent methyltransferase [Mucilaginibacter sp. X5P1]MBB6140534.1 tRNA (cmo5U34)-methyltransferase [Mucilaginibacter sp. X5P1]
MTVHTELKEKFGAVSKQYDSQRQYLIPCFNDFYHSCLPFIKTVTNAKTILDLGAGTGLFSQLVYEQNPHLQFTLADISAPMLSVAKERFNGLDNFKFIDLDFSSATIPGKYDIIISSLAIHHLEDADKQKLYTNVYKALNEGGLFINADQVTGRTMLFDSLYKYEWRETVSHSGLDHEALIQAFERTKLDKFAPLETQLIMLEEAGFTEVDCIYKNMSFAVFGGFKDANIETAVI